MTKPLTGQTLGSLVNPILKKIGQVQSMDAVQTYPIDSLMTGDVRSGEHTPLDLLDDFLSEQTKAMVLYSERPDANQTYLKNQLTRIAAAEQALEQLRKSKVEPWLYVHSCIRAAEFEFGLFGSVTINFPLRYDVPGTCFIDFINGRASIWKKQ